MKLVLELSLLVLVLKQLSGSERFWVVLQRLRRRLWLEFGTTVVPCRKQLRHQVLVSELLLACLRTPHP